MGLIKDVLKISDALDTWVILWVTYYILLYAITLYGMTMLLGFVTCYYITLDLYCDVFVAHTNPSSNTRMTDFFMFSYIASLPTADNYCPV